MPEMLKGCDPALIENSCRSAAAEYRYAADQLDRAARFLGSRRLKEAEEAFRRAISGVDRAEAAFVELDDPT